MSSAGQIVGGLIGGAIGSTVGNTFLGAQLGMMLGGYIDPPPGPVTEGPRLSDLTVQTSTYGAVLPDLYGTDAVTGNVFWLQGNKIDETPVKKKTGGKGGSKTTTITWVNTATFAIGLCKGPIAGVRRIWLKGELFYDAGSLDQGTITASNAAATGFHVYLGTDDQTPDSRIQADLGVDNAPAWRGRAYIVFYDLDLAPYGGTLVGVQVKVEVAKIGNTDDLQLSYDAPDDHWYGGLRYDGANFFSIATGSSGSTGGSHYTSGTSKICYSPDGQSWSVVNDLSGYDWVDIHFNGVVYLAVSAYGNAKVAYSSSLSGPWTIVTAPFGATTDWRSIIKGPDHDLLLVQGTKTALTTDGQVWTTSSAGFRNATSNSPGTYNGVVYCVALSDGATSNLQTSPVGLTWQLRSTPDAIAYLKGGCSNGRTMVFVGDTSCVISYDDGATWSNNYPLPTTESFYTISSNGTEYCLVPTVDSYPFNWYTSLDAITWTTHTRTESSLQLGGPCWDGAYWNILTSAIAAPSRFYRLLHSRFTAGTTTLGDVVADKCLSTNLLTSGDIDVTQLTDSVRGYTDSSTGAIRGALEPLQLAWPFDVRQKGYKIEFVRRGGNYTTTIDANDLDARNASNEVGVRITEAREMNLQLPKRVSIKYKDSDREYAVGEQYAERLNTSAVNEDSYELAVVMNSSEAAAAADVLLYMRWMERVDLSFNLPATYNQIEVADVVLLPVGGSWASVRVVSCNYTTDNRVEITGKFANPSTYTSTVVGVAPSVTGQTTLSLPGATEYVLLDVPTLHTAQLDPSFLVSMYGGSSWEGGVLIRSDDSGATWNDLQGFASPGGTVGSATNTIGLVDSRTWDNASELNVSMTNGDLFSVTAEAVLNGSNYMAYGADGRWEIIGVQTCTLVSSNTYTLRDMLRGRFGTEWAMTTHQAGDKVVLLSISDVVAIAMSTATIGLTRIYRGVTLDADIGTASNRSFTYNGVNLKPLSPAYSTFFRDVVTNEWSGTLLRRTRYGGEWADNVDVPLSEATERYEMDVFTDGSYTAVARTITSTTPSLSYSASQQLADFGAYVSTLYYKIYQMSSVIGRGYALVGESQASINSEYSVQITIPSTSVSANLTDYPVFIDLSLMSPSFWGSLAYNDGRDIRAANSSLTQIPVDLVFIDVVQKTGYMFVKTSLSSTVDTVIYVTCGLLASGLVAAGAANGRNAVWSNYLAVFTFGQNHVNRVGSSYTTANVSTTSMDVASTSPNVTSHQGVAWDGTYYYVSGTNKLTKYTSSWTLVASNTNPIGAVGFGTNHVGDIEVVNGVIYAPVENYTSITVFSSQRIARFSADTLAYIDSVSVSAQGHEVSSVAYCPTDGYLYVSSYNDGSKLWRYNLSTLAYVSALSLSSTITQVQGVTWWMEAFWVTSGSTKNTYRVEYAGNVRDSVYTASGSDDDYEGIGHTNSGLIVLVDSLNSPNNGVIRTLVPKTIGKVEAVDLVAPLDQFEYVSGLSRYTTWTMGLSMKMTSKSAAMAMMTYTINGSSANADRATLAYRLSSDRLGLWNDTDTWLLDTISPVVGTTYRINASHNGTSGRKFYRDGALTASAGSSTARPAAGANALVMGMESWTKGEDFAGQLGFAYLAPTVFSDPYIAAESANLTSPATFYSIVG